MTRLPLLSRLGHLHRPALSLSLAWLHHLHGLPLLLSTVLPEAGWLQGLLRPLARLPWLLLGLADLRCGTRRGWLPLLSCAGHGLHGTTLTILTSDVAARFAELLRQFFQLSAALLPQRKLTHPLGQFFKFRTCRLSLRLAELLSRRQHMLPHHTFTIFCFRVFFSLLERVIQTLSCFSR